MTLDLHYVNPRLVELYDSANPCGPDTDFYLQLATELRAQTIVDLGCGTGLLTRELARGDRQVIGIDPAPAMLAVARRNDGARRVQWVAGDRRVLGTPNADLVVMTGNVAQVFLDDAEWAATLDAICRALRPGGYLAFESRNPEARAWEQWNREATHAITSTPFGPIERKRQCRDPIFWDDLCPVPPSAVEEQITARTIGLMLLLYSGPFLTGHQTPFTILRRKNAMAHHLLTFLFTDLENSTPLPAATSLSVYP